MNPDEIDPRGLIREAYRIESITLEDCRSIFFDWAMGRGPLEGAPESVAALLALHARGREDHPMTEVLREGLAEAARPARRGGRAGRLRK